MTVQAKRPRPSRAEVHLRDPLWFKDAVIYQLHLKSFFDANNDGIGDFAGLISKLDYIADLGVNTIWLLPFYPSPRRDDGYDIADYRGVHPDYGTLGDVRTFIAEAHARGLRVITELVINHTSDQHPWFQRARKANPGSSARNFYVWSDTDQRYAGTRIIFVDSEKSNWTWDPVANAYYWHRFYSHQPDLNFDHPLVLKAVLSVLRYWMSLGVDGMRLDAVPYLVEREGTSNENLPETHAILKRIRAEVDAAFPDRMLLAEANLWPEDVLQYFGDDDECHMAFHFPLMTRMYVALAQEDRFPITDILRQTPEIPPHAQWAIFLRNHDELTLEAVTDKERDYLWAQYAADRRARLNLGIRRRLAPLMQRDRRRIELLNSLLLSMPGAPVLYYGDEIGMGDNIHLGDRDGVRTPMQWSSDRNGGFSRADPATLVLPPIMDPLYGYEAVNVEAQARDPHSLLNWMRRMLSIRRLQHAFGRGTLRLLYPSNRRVMAYLREYTQEAHTETVLCVVNVSRFAQAVELDLSRFEACVPVEMLGGAAFPPIGQLPYLLTLPPYGFFWFLLAPLSRMPAWFVPAPQPLPEFHTLVVRNSLQELLAEPIRSVLEREVLPAYLPIRRWFAGRDSRLESARIVQVSEVPGIEPPVLLTEIEARTQRGSDRYLLPFGFISEEAIAGALPQQLALARVRRGRHIGLLTDAFALDGFARRLIELLAAGARVAVTEGGELQFLPFGAPQALQGAAEAAVRRSSAEPSQSGLIVGGQIMLRLIRRLHAGPHPEAEMGRFLSERGFANIAPMLGEVVRCSADGQAYTLAIARGFIYNEGDGWSWTQNLLERAVQEALVMPAGEPLPEQSESLGRIQRAAALLGRRLGEMHVVLGGTSADPAFAPRPSEAPDCESWAASARAQLEAVYALIGTHAGIGEEERDSVELLRAQRERVLGLPETLARAGIGSLATRIHGELHLGRTLVSQGDVFFVDFEGDPDRPLAERRALDSPLRDVAGMLRSFDYAAATIIAAGGAGQDETAQTRKRGIVERFRQNSGKSFLTAYQEASAEIAHGWSSAHGARDLLNLFLLERAAYEVCHEAANRPSWLKVPLRGLAQLVGTL